MPRAFVLAIVLAACTVANPTVTPTPAPTREPGAVNVTALLDLTGSRVPGGASQRDSLQLWADQHASGIPRVRLRIVDVAGSPAKTVLELRRAVVEERADAVVVGVAVDFDAGFASAVQLAEVPVLFTTPIPDPAIAGGGWAFALAPTPAQLARVTLDDAATRAVLASSVIVSDESVTAVPERAALVADLERRGVRPTVIKVTAADVAQRLRMLSTLTPAVVFAGNPKTYIDAARSVPLGPWLYLSYLSELGDLADLRDAAASARWPGSRWMAAPATAGSLARVSFVQAFGDRAGVPTTIAATAYDALTLLANAAQDETDSARVRERLESTALAGVATTYTFSSSRHAGFAANDLALLRYAGPRALPILP